MRVAISTIVSVKPSATGVKMALNLRTERPNASADQILAETMKDVTQISSTMNTRKSASLNVSMAIYLTGQKIHAERSTAQEIESTTHGLGDVATVEKATLKWAANALKDARMAKEDKARSASLIVLPTKNLMKMENV